jgi:hypothetical protein
MSSRFSLIESPPESAPIPVSYHFDPTRPERIGACFRFGWELAFATLTDGRLEVAGPFDVPLHPEQRETIKFLMAWELENRLRRRRQGWRRGKGRARR